MTAKGRKDDRISVDIKGLRDSIGDAYDSPLWQNTALGTKIRVLIEERLRDIQLEKEGKLTRNE